MTRPHGTIDDGLVILENLIAGMAPHDAALLRDIMFTTDPVQTAFKIRRYYGDLDRAERTPRGLLYYHLGVLTGTIYRQAEKEDVPS